MKKNKISLNFQIDRDYLIIHTLSSIDETKFSSTNHKKDIKAFQDYAWKKNKSCYNLLVGKLSIEDVSKNQLGKIIKTCPAFLNSLKRSKTYKKIYSHTEKYLNFCKNQWLENFYITNRIVQEITGLKLNKKFDVYITHPSLKNGNYRGNNVITWGHNEDWSNYVTIYLWHEILHSYFGLSDLEHATIELIADEYLRTRLNGDKYPPFVGHKYLKKVKWKILPRWRKYLKLNSKDIHEFVKVK